MGKNTKISWAHHTQNFWLGCTKISAGCASCYAEAQMDHLYHRVNWGKGNPRVMTKTWRDPLKWDKEARDQGIRWRVFTNSLSDMFDEEVLDQWRDDAFRVIKACQNLDWLILTKRIQKAHDYLMALPGWPWPNVWVGTSVENQEAADYRIPILLNIPAKVRWLSMEPLLEPVNLFGMLNGLDWVVVGGESGEGYRKMKSEWAMSLYAQCQTQKVPFFCKQGSGPLSGCQYDLPAGLFSVKEYPRNDH